MAKKIVKRLKQWPLNELKSHRLQGYIITDVDDGALQLLIDSMQENGQEQPIEITAEGTIIDGHQRVRAAEKIGWSKIRVWIRSDLKTPLEVEHRFLQANLTRRQMSKLEMARAYVQLKKNSKRLQQQEQLDTELRSCAVASKRGDMRDQLAKLFDCSGRTLDRYAAILSTPHAVQQAFESGQLSLAEAVRVAGRDADTQLEIGFRISNGEDPKQVVAELAVPRKTNRYFRGTVRPGLDQLQTAVAELRDDIEQTKAGLTRADLPGLYQANKLIVEMIRHIKANPDQCRTFDERVQQMAECRGRSSADNALGHDVQDKSGLQVEPENQT